MEAGEILCSFTIMPIDLAEKYPQGEGRQEPNNDPYLPSPEGRIKLTINPIEMLSQLIPPHMKRKLLCILCVFACTYLMFLFGPILCLLK